MFYVFFVMACLFFCGDSKSMEMTSLELQLSKGEPKCLSRRSWGKRVAIGQCPIPVELEEKIKRYPAQGVDTITISGAHYGENKVAGCGRIQLQITQVTDDSLSEGLIIQADKNIFSCIDVNRQGVQLDVGFRLLQENLPAKDIVILLALKNYKKIVTNNAVDTTFFSPIKADILQINLTAGATMCVPFIEANRVGFLVEGSSQLRAQDNASIKAKDLLSIHRHGLAKVMLAIETKLLRAQSNGKGEMRLAGIATEQELLFREGSFFGMDLQCKKIRVAEGTGPGELELCANSITGYVLASTKYDPTYRPSGEYPEVELYPFKDAEWNAAFLK